MTGGVPLIDLKAQWATLSGDVLAAVHRVFENQTFILGAEVEAFERRIGAWLGTPRALGVSSGTDALLCALMALDVKPGDRVLTTPFSFFATAGAIARLGARPEFTDIDPDTFAMDVARVLDRDPARYRGVVPVHLFGRALDLEPLIAWAARSGAFVLEDAAQALGARIRGRAAGLAGDAGAFSFFPTKNLGGAGDGGLLTARDDELFARQRRLRTHGGDLEYRQEEVGGNFRLDALQAAVLAVKLERLESWNQARLRNARRYEALFGEAGLRDRVVLPGIPDDGSHIVHQYVVRVPRRDTVREALRASGIGTGVYYPVPLHLLGCFRHLGYRRGDFPEAERAAEDVLALPIYPELVPDQQARVVESIGKALG